MPLGLADGLVAAGHDVQSVATSAAGIDDRAVLDLARRGGRWLLTFDSDFGDLMFHKGEAPPAATRFQPASNNLTRSPNPGASTAWQRA